MDYASQTSEWPQTYIKAMELTLSEINSLFFELGISAFGRYDRSRDGETNDSENKICVWCGRPTGRVDHWGKRPAEGPSDAWRSGGRPLGVTGTSQGGWRGRSRQHSSGWRSWGVSFYSVARLRRSDPVSTGDGAFRQWRGSSGPTAKPHSRWRTDARDRYSRTAAQSSKRRTLVLTRQLGRPPADSDSIWQAVIAPRISFLVLLGCLAAEGCRQRNPRPAAAPL